ncbi:MAG TPA: peptidase domain-containing ABC transporter [Holophagaceae bacterium]|nr:peptidase domain-containing ABC transporter [Holophagaceae bacterium]
MAALSRLLRRKAVPYVPQMEAVECGAACLAMVLGYHGRHVPLPEMRQACSVSRDGVNALALLRAARDQGLEAEAFRAEVEDLGELPLPAVLHWEFRHFVVLERLHPKKGALLVDPSDGRRWVSPARLRQAYTGVVLAFEPGPDFEPRPEVRPSLARYRRLVLGNAPSLAQLLGLSVVLQIAGIIFPVGQQILVDRVIVPRQEPWLWGLGVALIAAMLVQSLLTLARSWVLTTLQTTLDLDLLKSYVGHILRLPIGFFLLRRPGDLIQRMDSNSAVQSMLSAQAVSSLLDSFLVLGYGGLMLAYDARLGLLVIGIGAGRFAFQGLMRNYSRRLLSAELTASGNAGGALLESLTTLETVKAVGAESHMIRRWTDRMVERSNASLKRQRLEVLGTQVMALLSSLGSVAVFWLAGREVLASRMTIGVFSAFLSLRSLFLTPLGSLVASFGKWQYLSSHLQRLDDILESAPEAAGAEAPGPLQGRIDIEGVGFRYAPGAPEVLRDIEVHIAPGEKVALVGPSGAGKTTLARLMLGMLLPTEGLVRFDGRDLRAFDLSALRRRMGVVLQETFIFNDTARANLALNNPGLRLPDLKRAGELACIHEVIEALPQGYDTPLGENGAILSGGQRQRLALARALAHQPSILLLDEATSSLDRDTEAQVHANLAALGCTRIVIAHRLATVQDADRILVLDGGRIVQEGRYEELAAQPGLFQSLVEAMERHIA